MKLKINYYFFTLLLFISAKMTSQTVNLGDLYISPGTIVSTLGILHNKNTGILFNDGDFYVYNHYINDGLVSFTPELKTGITRMIGLLSFQEVSGSIPMEWYDAEFKNNTMQPAFHLYNQINIFGTLDFNKGIIDNDNYGGMLIFENQSTHRNVNSDSHTDGKVQKKGKESFTYPIGDKNKYRFSAISAPDEIASSFDGKYFYDDSNLLYPHNRKSSGIQIINNQEYWTLNKSNGKSDVMLTLSWDEFNTTPSSIVSPPENLIHIVRWDSNLNLWVDEGGIVDNMNKTVTTPINVSGYSVFTTARVIDSALICKDLVIHNAFSPNGDEKNDYFKIDGLTECSNNNLIEIYNRWGVKVFETSNYGSNGNFFKGYSDGRATVSKSELLPSGVYFYVLKITISDIESQTIKKAGYLYLNKE